MQIILPPTKQLVETSRLWLVLVLVVALVDQLASDLNRLTSPTKSSSLQTTSRSQETSIRWFLAPVEAADTYGDSVSGSSPSVEAALEDDDDEDADAELDSAASQEYPEGDGDGDDDSYGDADGDGDGADEDGDNDRQDSSLHHIWTRPGRHNLLRRTRRATSGATGTTTASLDNNKDEDFAIDDGDEDAWVHDGIDDIHIDPETKRAASELSKDNEHASIDSEYDPNGQQQQQQQQGQSSADQPTIMNRTRITTIAEVIPLIKPNSDDDSDSNSNSNSNNNNDDDFAESRQRAPSSPMFAQAMTLNARPSSAVYMPAAYLSLDQVQRLIDQQQRQQIGRRQQDDDDQEDDFGDSWRLRRPLLRQLPVEENQQPEDSNK